MLNLIIGIVIFIFVFMGLREGLAKAVGSVAVVFFSLFLATIAVNFLARGSSQLGDPNYLGTMVVFAAVWVVSYLACELLLVILLNKIIKITVLGSLDRFGGIAVGAFKGILICGIALQVALYLPISQDSKLQIKEALLSRIAITTYEWFYPLAIKIAPKIEDNNLLNKMKTDVDTTSTKKELEKIKTEDLLDTIGEAKKVVSKEQEKAMRLLKENKLLPGVPAKE
ncbi:hypothetical protein A3H38_06065 [candidate division WOR-1 bacterium RIFCSPLOWO2_02_FULL_46_20]|uniref:Colicin V production protein n=2 Tax=Saganbacteria TaxID=1703751 RepID=A0A1F4RBG3_UNCSA|nr:MAG: hypothetical protein A3J44_02620 [candidate division WOR-1 bacterium RIFCSPHIGHO2_02_FULL_45_12]OGC05527.1 MAG: hypothetical protein A3H38_06065 [candidate division WOR-1 bacterium RIFCSPLOWO2_02_FULL_46_20]OGC09188.1 MAG: hypothetical protein A3F86_05545 [candidate division WOR-1 bacterium RIFCSPLOWO2_12_FULL_45_9]